MSLSCQWDIIGEAMWSNTEDREHLAPVYRAEVEDAVPRQNAVKMAIETQRTHICNDPVIVRKAIPAHSDDRCRRVYARHFPEPRQIQSSTAENAELQGRKRLLLESLAITMRVSEIHAQAHRVIGC